MTIREQREALEEHILSPAAQKSGKSKGRIHDELKDGIRTDFQRDRDRIIHSKAFRRLKHKTQVYISPEGDHYRTRLTHTLEVSQIARTICCALRLNEDLVEAIALGHDLGHTPFGHIGEDVLNGLNPQGFRHYEQSIRVVDFLESKTTRTGLNLTWEVRDGIVNHTGDREAHTLEGKVIKYADRIAYINHDIDDSIRAGVLQEKDLPVELTEVLGNRRSVRINTMVMDLITESLRTGEITMSKDVYTATMALRKFMFDRVYFNSQVKEEESKAHYVISHLFHYFLEYPEALPSSHTRLYERLGDEQRVTDAQMVTDYIAGMTDTYVSRQFQTLFLPKSWSR